MNKKDEEDLIKLLNESKTCAPLEWQVMVHDASTRIKAYADLVERLEENYTLLMRTIRHPSVSTLGRRRDEAHNKGLTIKALQAIKEFKDLS